MDTISNTVWQRKGSSIIFDQEQLAPFLEKGAVVSLCDALGWMKAFPPLPPVNGQTIVICGIETMLETLAEDAVDDFLIQRVRPLLMKLQNHWTACGVVLGFSFNPNKFEESPMQEEVLFKRGTRSKVRLSEGLWDGSATVNMRRIVDIERRPGQEIIIGYYVARIS